MSSKIENINDSDVRFMYEIKGKTQQEIADYYGVCQTTIHFRLYPEKQKEHNDKYSKTENTIESKKRYWQTDKGKETKKKYEKSDKGKVATRRYQKSGKFKKAIKRYFLTENGKVAKKKANSKRRELGFIPLNLPFGNSESHHIDIYHIINIPKELHQSIPHNVRTGEGMAEINTISFEYITEETFDKLITDRRL